MLLDSVETGAAWEFADTLRGEAGDEGFSFRLLGVVSLSVDREDEERECGLSCRVVEERMGSIVVVVFSVLETDFYQLVYLFDNLCVSFCMVIV